MELPDAYLPLANAIERGDVESGVAEAQLLAESGTDLVSMFQDAIEPLMRDIGDRFSRLEVFLPEMVRSANVVKAIQAAMARSLVDGVVLEPHGKVVIGTAFGDIHDIGKNMVITMLEVNGFEVVDLGVGVEPLEFVKRSKEADADVICISSLLTSSIPYMEETVKMVKESPTDRARFKVAVGGGPVTPERAENMGADAYGEDASEAVTQMFGLLEGGQP